VSFFNLIGCDRAQFLWYTDVGQTSFYWYREPTKHLIVSP